MASVNKKRTWNPGKANPKQKQFFESRTMFTAYGGAKGGGKTWAVRTKAIGGAIFNPGIKILIMRSTFREVDENHIQPICNEVIPLGITKYNNQNHRLSFTNGSTIQFGNWEGEESERHYNGMEYDWIFIDEATQFTERAFNFLGGCLRGVNDFPKRMYLTCNPGGVGHQWVKRLFIDKQYKTDSVNPEENENPEDYTFIFATVEDNKYLLESSPLYLRNLANMPEDVMRAYRYGDWNAIGGNYFKEFSRLVHVVKPFGIPKHWERYRAFDYGLDMFSIFWCAIDEDGRIWVYRHYEHKDLIVSEACKQAIEHTPMGERIKATYAPPDMWNRQRETGRSMSEVFAQNGLPIIKSDNNRVQGHMLMKEMFSVREVNDPYVKQMTGKDRLPMLMFMGSVETKVFSDLESIQADDDNPNDCAKIPHDVTHSIDALRYLCISRMMAAQVEVIEEEEDSDGLMDYDSYMTGGVISHSYMGV